MFPIVMTVLCSTSIALILKWNNTLKASEIYLLMGNYLTAAFLSFLFWNKDGITSFSWQTLVFGIFIGGLFVYAFFAFTKAVAAAGAALATVSARLSVAIPVLLSIIVFKELPNNLQITGFAFVLLTLFLFYFSLQNGNKHSIHWLDLFYLFALWLGIGLNDFSLKIFQAWRGTGEKSFFLLVIFLSALIYTLLVIRLRRLPFDRVAFSMGLFLGVPNMFSTFFLLGALSALPAVVVYPTVNLGIILLTAFASYIIWREKLNMAGWLALLSGSLAIVLLNLKT